ncbi:MAG: glycosyltransferase [Bacteroidetes bacterium]|jgi:GT2 family glycosyltransferase|nr:glycosyltransferase [Bacteroidota bacterium]
MLKLSIILVNYNVKHFLAQALTSVQRAIQHLPAEVFVVDNNSVDGSLAMLRKHYPWVKLIANRDNVGFSKANNQAIAQSRGEYVVLLNPDTIVEEDTFTKVLAYLDAHPRAGGLGVKMVNGKGEFLPESKRALPTPWVAFYKVFGLARLFPRSRRFGRYHLSYLDPNKNHRVEVLSGACMFLRRQMLEEIGYLDEDYFMYGEDIDLSYRITQAGYENHYFSGTQIIHYKGESTRKGSLNYVLVFYRAMLIFAEKHFSKGRRRLFMLLIQLAIYFRASLSIGSRVLSRSLFPLLEWIVIYGISLSMGMLYDQQVLQQDTSLLSDRFYLAILAPIYATTFVLLLLSVGAYARPYRLRLAALGSLFGFIGIATLNFIFQDLNISRGTVLLIAAATLLSTILLRAIATFMRGGSLFLDQIPQRRYLIVGSRQEAERVQYLLAEQIYYPHVCVGIVLPNDTGKDAQMHQGDVLGVAGQLDEIIRYYKIEEVVFCNQSLSTHEIIRHMTSLASQHIHFKIVPHQADYLIGPNVILSSAASQPLHARLEHPEVRFRKQVFDYAASLLLLLCFPLTAWLYRAPGSAIRALVSVLMGKRHLVGYIDGTQPELPRIKHGVLTLEGLLSSRTKGRILSRKEKNKLDYHYAHHYSLSMDWEILVRGIRSIGVSPAKAA